MEPVSSAFIFTSIKYLAKKCGLTDFVKEHGKKVLEDKLQKEISDKLDGCFKGFFTSTVKKAFETAFKEIAPENKTIRRKFVLEFLTDPLIAETIEKNRLPQPEIFNGIINRLLPGKDTAQITERIITTLYKELSKDQQFVNLVTLSMPGKLDKLISGQEKILEKVEPAKRENPFFVPAAPVNFIGRIKPLEKLRERLITGSDVVSITGSATVGIHGMAGLGKTYLALRFAHENDLLEHFDGIFHQFCGDNPVGTIVTELAEKAGIDIKELPPDKAI